MAKDFAFMFYPGDYLRDTQCLSENTQVVYDKIMCEHMRNICISKSQLKFFTKKLSEDEIQELMTVLTEVNDGFQISWVAVSIEKRNKYTESRRSNRNSKAKKEVNISSTYVKHMSNTSESHERHMEDENENRIDNTKHISEINNSYLLKEIGGVGERENFIDSQDASSENAGSGDDVSQNLLPQESFSEPPLQNTTRSEPNQFPLEEKKEEKNHARVVYGGEPAHDSKPITPDADFTPKTSRRTNDNLPDGIPIYLKDFEAYKEHLREFYKTFIDRTPKSVKFMDEMVNRYDNLDFQKTLKMNVVDYWATEEGYKTKLKAAKAALRTNKGKTYDIDWYQTLATSIKYPTNRLYLSFDERMKKKEVTLPPIPPSLPHGYIDLNAPIKRAE